MQDAKLGRENAATIGYREVSFSVNMILRKMTPDSPSRLRPPSL